MWWEFSLTVSEGAVRKYIRVMQHVIDHYGVDMYTRQRVEGLVNSTDSLFKIESKYSHSMM